MFGQKKAQRCSLLTVGALAMSLVLMASLAAAQSGTSGTISGTVRDESGGALPGVTATLTSPALQVRQIVQVTDATGNYQFVDLPASTYRLTFELSGFSTAIREDLRLTVGFNARVDADLKVGAITESVTVTGQSPVIDVTSTTTSVTLTSEELNEIPRGRDLAMIYSTAPGITLAGTPDVGGSNMANRQNISDGGVALQPKLQLEGMNIVLSDDQNSGVYMNNDTIEEIQLKTSGNDAEVMVPGVSMVAVIKSGGNDFHGRYGYALQRPALQSSNLDDHLRSQGLTATQPVKDFHDYQADLGGRILTDKLWFYVAYSSQLKETGITGFVQDAGPDGRYLTGDEPIAIATTGIDQFSMKYLVPDFKEQSRQLRVAARDKVRGRGRRGPAQSSRAHARLHKPRRHCEGGIPGHNRDARRSSTSSRAMWAGGPTTAQSASRRNMASRSFSPIWTVRTA